MESSGKLVVLVILVFALSISVGYFLGAGYGLGRQPGVGEEGIFGVSGKGGVMEVGLENKVVKFIAKSVSGNLKAISGRTMILEAKGNTLSIEVAEEARINRLTIYSPKPPEPGIPPEEIPEEPEPENITEQKLEEIDLIQLKAGDRVDALLNSQPDGSFIAVEVTVMVEAEL